MSNGDDTICCPNARRRVVAAVARSGSRTTPHRGNRELGHLRVVVRGASGRVVDGVRIVASGPAKDTKDGVVFFRNLTPGSYSVRPNLGRLQYKPHTAVVEAGKTTQLAIRLKTTITGRIVALTFRSDHLDAAGKKLIRRTVAQPITVAQLAWNTATKDIRTVTKSTTSNYDDSTDEFQKPEWDDARGGSADSHPISHTMGQKIKLDIDVEFTAHPPGESGNVEKLNGDGGHPHLAFEAVKKSAVSGMQRVTVTGLEAKQPLPNQVDGLKANIAWKAVAEGRTLPLGQTGPHRMYITFDQPAGKMEYRGDFVETGPDQIVTEYRLWRAVEDARGKGAGGEKQCVDAVFSSLYARAVGYVLGRRWSGATNDTGVSPKPSLHHYLWLCTAGRGQGECHNIAAAFALECRILGVKGSFAVGYMYPWPSRADTAPYAKTKAKSPGGFNVLGKLDQRYQRIHAHPGHGAEAVVFLDGTDRANNFEGVTVYNGNALYAIGDAVFDLYAGANDNASSYFADRGSRAGSIRPVVLSWNRGAFELRFSSTVGKGWCKAPYGEGSREKFRWES
jgi:hypothetical protein